MQTIIMTVGTSLRTNRDEGLSLEARRPWAGKRVSNDERMIDGWEEAIAWMSKIDLELISAETNTFWRLDLTDNDEIVLLHSATTSGLECAELLREFLKTCFGQKDVRLCKIPGIDYELDQSKSALEKMAELLKKLVEEAKGDVTLAATGGFKAQTMIMALVGNACGVPVCYIHEDYKGLVYLPYIKSGSIGLAPSPPGPLSHQGRGGARYKSDTSGHNITSLTLGKLKTECVVLIFLNLLNRGLR